MGRRESRGRSHEKQEGRVPNIAQVKNNLIARLNSQIKNLNFVRDMDSLERDEIFCALQDIDEQARRYDLTQIQKLAQLAKGKRILNLEIERKRNQLENKKMKKKVIEDFFRENRIKQVDYHDMAVRKINEKTFIVAPYPSGRAFIESDNIYTAYLPKVLKTSFKRALQDCQYLPTIKSVNKIFFKNFSEGSVYSNSNSFNSFLIRIGLFLLLLEIVLCLVLFSVQFEEGKYGLFVNSFLVIMVFLCITIKNFFEETSCKYQLQETIQEVTEYFEKINSKFKEQGKNIEWSCPDSFLYLQIKFGVDYILYD